MTNTIKMPKRFDYSASGEFNTAISAALGEDASDQKIQLDWPLHGWRHVHALHFRLPGARLKADHAGCHQTDFQASRPSRETDSAGG